MLNISILLVSKMNYCRYTYSTNINNRESLQDINIVIGKAFHYNSSFYINNLYIHCCLIRTHMASLAHY